MLKVYFNSVEVPANSIVGLSQHCNPYGKSFALGTTHCREFNLQVLNNGFSGIPSSVQIYENNDLYATLIVDSYNDINSISTEFTLTDCMTLFNKKLEYEEGQSLLQILNNACEEIDIELETQEFYMDDFVINWTEDIVIRDLISYVAEVNGGYAYINNEGNLVIVSYNSQTPHSLSLSNTSGYKIGDELYYDRVYVELAAATKYYPETSDNDTLYLNSNNILFNDSQGYTIEAIVQHIYSLINGLTFRNIDIEKCLINQNIKAGDFINLLTSEETSILSTENDLTIVDNNSNLIEANVQTSGVIFIANIDWTYNSCWNGGYSFEVNNSKQEETKIIDGTFKSISIKVDRALGVIEQQVADNTQGITTITQRADGLDITVRDLQSQIDEGLDVTEVRTSKGFTFDDDGLTITDTGASIQTTIDESGMEVSDKGKTLLEAKNDGVNAYRLNAKGYITFGTYSRMMDYSPDGETRRTGCFWVEE